MKGLWEGLGEQPKIDCNGGLEIRENTVWLFLDNAKAAIMPSSFSTVPSLAPDDYPPTFWSTIDFSTDLHRDVVSRILFDKDSLVRYDAEYMTPSE